MKHNGILYLILTALFMTGIASCEREIDVDYPTPDAKVVIEGQISNEGAFVRISRSRPMADSTKCHPIGNAQVWIGSEDGSEDQLFYDDQKQCYLPATPLVGTPEHTYHMRAIVDGNRYEAAATMPPPAVVDTIFFRWADILHQAKLYFVCVKGNDPYPDRRCFYLCRLMRGQELFSWNTRSGRSNINGKFEYDMICATDNEMEETKDNNGKRPLEDGDTLRLELMTIDHNCWYYYQSLASADLTTSNPLTNISGGALGVFTATSITRPDTLIFNREEILESDKQY